MSAEKEGNPFLGTHSDIFQNRFVLSILLSGIFLQAGIWIRNFSVLLFVMKETNGNALAISMISIAEYAPIFIFSFIGGTFADRWRPKRTMVWCDLLSAFSVFAVFFTLVLGAWQMVFAATLISSILSQFSQPAGMKLFKKHVSEDALQTAMSVYQAIFALFMVLGPILGSFVYQSAGINFSIAATGAAFLLSAGALSFIPENNERVKRKTTILEEMKAGFQYMWRRRDLRLLGIGFSISGMAIGLVQPLNIFLVTERLGLPEENLQWLLTLNGAGMLVGGAFTMVYSKTIPPQILLTIGMFANAAGMGLVGLSTNFWFTLSAEFAVGLFLPAIQISITSLILKNTSDSFVGRVNGILTPLFTGSMVIAMSLAGQFKKIFSLAGTFEIAAVLFFAGFLVIFPLNKRTSKKKQAKKLQI